MKNTDGTEVWRPSSEPQQNTVRVEIPLHVPGYEQEVLSVELKPCPFCGGAAEQCEHGPNDTSIGCDDCGYFMTGNYVIAVWNTRV